MLGLYLHIPFCSAICGYCNFNRGLLDGPLKTRYVAALRRELLEAGDRHAGADTIFFGGGTPSLLEPEEIGLLIESSRASYALSPDAEITLETNPETATASRLAAFRSAGINRISFGVQSLDDAELQRLGRIHSSAKAEEVIGLARAAGFDNVGLDLMLWLPGQSQASWMHTVERAVALAPDHLSLYLLELYPNAPLQQTMARGSSDGASKSSTSDRHGPTAGLAPWQQVSDDEAADMYLAGLLRLDAAGYEQYEISNVARRDASSRHNLKYWQSGDWRGFGCGAHSTVAGRRWRNVNSTADYVDRIDRGVSPAMDGRRMSETERMEESLFTGLRLTEGIDAEAFAVRHGVDPWSRYGNALAPCVDDGLMWKKGTRFGLTRRGMLVANEILVTFV